VRRRLVHRGGAGVYGADGEPSAIHHGRWRERGLRPKERSSAPAIRLRDELLELLERDERDHRRRALAANAPASQHDGDATTRRPCDGAIVERKYDVTVARAMRDASRDLRV
ncbi:MAG TPA: hypothetical protein VM890_01270, partial [Longimicrobium sp.]|jgi:hypothetical protein|nr:hypothetical protein [Longimicrobium sp.]